MGRKCVVAGCGNTDQIILCHRFPKRPELAMKWAENLKVQNISLNHLICKYTVCCLHFEATAYRNYLSNHLNSTAEPTLAPLNSRVRESNDVSVAPAETLLEADASNQCTIKAIAEHQPLIIDNSENGVDTSAVLGEDLEPHQNVNKISEDADDADETINLNRETSTQICEEDLEDIIAGSPHEDDNDKNQEIEYVIEEYYECGNSIAEVIECDDVPPEDDSCSSKITIEQTYKHFQDASSQVDVDQLEQNADTDNKYAHLTRKELIDLLETQKKLLSKQREELEHFQTAHSYLLRRVDVFNNILTGS